MRADTENKGYLNFEDFFDLLIPYSQENRENLQSVSFCEL